MDYNGAPIWEPYWNLINGDTPQLVVGFHRQNPHKPPMPVNFDTLVGQQGIIAAAAILASAPLSMGLESNNDSGSRDARGTPGRA